MKLPERFDHFIGFPSETERIYNLKGSSAALFLAIRDEAFIAVEGTEQAAERLCEDIVFFSELLGHPSDPPVFLPDPDGAAASGQRALFAHKLSDISLVTSLRAITAPLWSRGALDKISLFLSKGSEAGREAVEEKLVQLGYRRVSTVMEKGEYCPKGWLMDIFPSTGDYPVRIEYYGDVIESLRYFDIDTQRSLRSIESLLVMPAMEPTEDSALEDFPETTVFTFDLPRDEMPFPGRSVALSRYDIQGEGYNAGLLSLKGLGIYPDERQSFTDIAPAIARLSRTSRVILVCSSDGQVERIGEIFSENGFPVPFVDRREVLQHGGAVALTKGNLSLGLHMPGFMILTEHEILGERSAFRPIRKSRISHLLSSMDDINPGDLVVHRDHGIGKFISLQKYAAGDNGHDLMVIEYASGDRLYVPLYNIDAVRKYSAGEGAPPALDRLGGKTWQRKKARVKKAVEELAERLIRLYAEREVVSGNSFSPDSEFHREFYSFFPYEETSDQLKAIDEISRDMETDRPMDRLLCGDVGYGKTEVAMRAAFKAVYDGKQVAVLVPTTILCEQHYHTFKSRFSAFPVRIGYLSRFKTKREQDATVLAINRGEIDIVIGTHSLLRKDIAFRDLGLLVIDEEHRFGVGQKERIKELKKGVHVLTMTATPIPRTLQMAISGVRGMSVIETPPEERLSVRNVVAVFGKDLIREAIEREVRRGGQVLFVHNTVFDIEKTAEFVRGLLPSLRLGVAHGQMAEKTLERVMLGFMRGEIDILVSTTIIGSGIDIPTANTIIIDRADKIGLSDLYQLRGRVGRSNVRAYAYFLVPGFDVISDESKKRLQAISEMSYLGAGFRLALKDLEMRGAGNFLGTAQSGHIHAVGFDTYIETLERAVAELKGAEIAEIKEPSISLKTTAHIPEDYIEDSTVRLGMYRRIASVKKADELRELAAEMEDRFGKAPQEVSELFGFMEIKVLARCLGVSSIIDDGKRIRVSFEKPAAVTANRLLSLQNVFPSVHFSPDGFELSAQQHKKGSENFQSNLHQALSFLASA